MWPQLVCINNLFFKNAVISFCNELHLMASLWQVNPVISTHSGMYQIPTE